MAGISWEFMFSFSSEILALEDFCTDCITALIIPICVEMMTQLSYLNLNSMEFIVVLMSEEWTFLLDLGLLVVFPEECHHT